MTLTRLFKITIAIFAILILGVLGGFATSVGAEEIPEGSLLAHISSDNVTTYFTEYNEGIYYASTNGGTLKLLVDREDYASMLLIGASYGDFTFDLNGHALENAYFVTTIYKLTVIDSSEDKTGYINTGAYACSVQSEYGSLIFDGVSFIGGVYAYDGLVKFSNSTLNASQIRVIDGSVLLDNITVEEHGLYLHMQTHESRNIKLQEATINGKLALLLEGSVMDYAPVSILLDEGYAFAKDGEVIYGGTRTISGVTTVSHSHDDENVISMPYGTGHTEANECGVITSDNPTIHDHEINEEFFACEFCALPFPFLVKHGENSVYMIDTKQVTEYIHNLDGDIEIIILSDYVDYMSSLDCFGENNITLDLNGNELGLGAVYTSTGSTLVIKDSSEEQTGVLSAERINYSIVIGYGTVIFESGTVKGIFDLSGDETNEAHLIVNGGKIESPFGIIFYDYVKVEINGGIIDSESSVFESNGRGDLYEIIVRGGVFPSGFDVAGLIDCTIGKCIKSNGDCTIKLYTLEGDIIEDNSLGYVGPCFVSHSCGVITSDGTTHTGVCETCDVTYLYGEHVSSGSVISESDSSLHIDFCGYCSYAISSEAHFGGTATCLQKAVCESCEVEYGNYNYDNHESTETYFTSGIGPNHILAYECCRTVKLDEPHYGGEATCTEQAICEFCNVAYGAEPEGHKYDNGCDTTCNVCSDTREIEHTYNNDGVCSVCGDTNGPNGDTPNGDTPNENTPNGDTPNGDTPNENTPNENKPNENTPNEDTPKKMGTGVVALICIGSALALGGGGFSLYWFVLRKKK